MTKTLKNTPATKPAAKTPAKKTAGKAASKPAKPVTLTAQWPQLKSYNAKQCGTVPTGAQLAQVVTMGYRQGANNAFALAMYLRKAGATQAQISVACGGPNLNVFRTIANKKASVNGTKASATQTKDGKQTVYHVTAKAA